MSLQPEKQSRGPADGPDTGSLESNAESTATHLGVVRAHSLDDFMKKKRYGISGAGEIGSHMTAAG